MAEYLAVRMVEKLVEKLVARTVENWVEYLEIKLATN